MTPYVNIPAKGTQASKVADRYGYEGPIQLSVPDFLMIWSCREEPQPSVLTSEAYAGRSPGLFLPRPRRG